MDETGPNLFQMMENAGRNLAELVFEKMGEGWRNAKIVVLAGTGGNGGGGICAARHLANRGANVKLCISDVANLGEVPAYQRHIYQNAGGVEISFEELSDEPASIILDAVIGYSLQSAPYGLPMQMINWANEQDALKLSLDVPSGVDSTTGETPGDFVRSDYTMTLALPKTGLLPHLSGELFLADIGIPAETYSRLDIPFQTPFDSRFRIPIKAQT
jgi:NAD(P)H-hydrate epimerase